jgi:hypothetical protein
MGHDPDVDVHFADVGRFHEAMGIFGNGYRMFCSLFGMYSI